MRLLIAAAVTFASAPAFAQSASPYPVSIPQECVSIAKREGVPAVIRNDRQASKARAALARLDDSNPRERNCLQAVARAILQ